MKKLFTGFCIVSLLSFSEMHAQHESNVWKNDPTYSANNYKHPNKAAAAKKIDYQREVQGVTMNEQAFKQSVTKVMIPARKITATHRTSAGKVKTSLAVRRKATEKQSTYTDYTNIDEQLDD
jgi:hypothetical protein